MNQYLYGDSSKAAQYKKLLSRLYFPNEVDYFGNELTDLVADPDTEFEIGKSDSIMAVHFRKVTLMKGARLIFKGIVDFTANELMQVGEASDKGSYISIGSNGSDASEKGKLGNPGICGAIPGGDGGAGGNGGKGGDGKDEKYHHDGGNGGQGGRGNGGSAGPSGPVGAAGSAGKPGECGAMGKITILPYMEPKK